MLYKVFIQGHLLNTNIFQQTLICVIPLLQNKENINLFSLIIAQELVNQTKLVFIKPLHSRVNI